MRLCKRCQKPIEFKRTLRGRTIPVDPGQVAVITKRGTVVQGHVVHFCTCDGPGRKLPEELNLVQRMFTPI